MSFFCTYSPRRSCASHNSSVVPLFLIRARIDACRALLSAPYSPIPLHTTLPGKAIRYTPFVPSVFNFSALGGARCFRFALCSAAVLFIGPFLLLDSRRPYLSSGIMVWDVSHAIVHIFPVAYVFPGGRLHRGGSEKFVFFCPGYEMVSWSLFFPAIPTRNGCILPFPSISEWPLSEIICSFPFGWRPKIRIPHASSLSDCMVPSSLW